MNTGTILSAVQDTGVTAQNEPQQDVDPIIFPVTGHRLFYGEYGEPNSVVRKERITIDGVKDGEVRRFIVNYSVYV